MNCEDQGMPAYVDVTIVEFAAHTAYLDPVTGVGYLVMPRPGTDVEPLEDPLVEAAWSERLGDLGPRTGLSLHAADHQRALAHLEQLGWCLLYDEDGRIETAGRTMDGRPVLCIYGPPRVDEPTLQALDGAIIALDIAADVDLDTQHTGGIPADGC